MQNLHKSRRLQLLTYSFVRERLNIQDMSVDMSFTLVGKHIFSPLHSKSAVKHGLKLRWIPSAGISLRMWPVIL